MNLSIILIHTILNFKKHEHLERYICISKKIIFFYNILLEDDQEADGFRSKKCTVLVGF